MRFASRARRGQDQFYVGNYEETPRGIYDKIMNVFYYAYFGLAVLLFQIAIERFGGIKGRFVFLLEGIGILVVLAILVNIPHMF
ncbi:hypothetical protein DA802_01855 [Shouchella clausii]|nr:hypothetical protein DA802_01855 [Shouchella clausii]